MRIKNTYIGNCYLGNTEIVKPVFRQEKPVCVIYLGNLLLKNKKIEIKKKIEKKELITGVKKDLLYERMKSLYTVSQETIEKLQEIVDIIHYYIHSLIDNKNIKLHKNPRPSSPIYHQTKNWIIDSVQIYINEYYNKNLKLSQLAALYFIHPHYLCKLFKKETGVNFSKYVNQVRIENAKNFLQKTDDKIINIGLKVGYNNVTYFNRVFKEYTGMTPGEYRDEF